MREAQMYKEKINSTPRLLILSCSQKKRPAKDLLPALERYDGPAYRVVNKFMRTHPSEAQMLDVHILSAKFGLIPASESIPYYDCRMTQQRIKELQESTLDTLEQITVSKRYDDVFINLGKDYLQVLNGYQSLIPDDLNVIVSTGTIGGKLSELHNWLHERTPGSLNSQVKIVQRDKVYLHGIALIPKQIMEDARFALSQTKNIPKYQIWYAQIDDQQVPVKWLVSQLTGLPVNTFHTNEARQVLVQLGIRVHSKMAGG